MDLGSVLEKEYCIRWGTWSIQLVMRGWNAPPQWGSECTFISNERMECTSAVGFGMHFCWLSKGRLGCISIVGW
jgi:hypothetical protein